MSASSVIPTVSALDHERLQRVASAGMQIRRLPPSAKFLASELERARVVSPASLPPNVISMHSVFDFQDGITEQIRRAMLVYPGEEDAGAERISVLSPLGAALIGLAEGQLFPWRSATGVRRTLQVIRVVHQPERANGHGDHHVGAATAVT
ncbi:nucleoside diphosphate kinase regulator [Microvirga guangxiensis]|uniref:Regulator of nucleoside diphosphate kinase n=1 Tax=Microvirga guangxiensis TaxID=549386 RepID=A0A1G5H4D0_9HYPH|nr:nucleoside diphosphate kinase regulator [Microvirga guangxiensis]SCY57798.1 regulator of nucleoside diphosphate kinase [Microvirga guangxiensis]